MKKLGSKEWTIIFIEFLIAGFMMLFSLKINSFFNSTIFTLMIILIVIIIIIVSVFGIIYKRIGEIDEALEIQEKKYTELEEKLKRSEQLINIKADIKYLKSKI